MRLKFLSARSLWIGLNLILNGIGPLAETLHSTPFTRTSRGAATFPDPHALRLDAVAEAVDRAAMHHGSGAAGGKLHPFSPPSPVQDLNDIPATFDWFHDSSDPPRDRTKGRHEILHTFQRYTIKSLRGLS